MALVGCGGFGKFLLRALQSSSALRITAAADTDPRALADVRKMFGIKRLTRNPQEVFRDATIDAVHIATPPHTHVSLSRDALRAGKHVVVEKPLALKSRDARHVVQLARRLGRVLAVNHLLRYNAIIQMLRALVRSDAFGTLRWLMVENIAHRVESAEHWFWNVQLSGGIHLEHGVHFFDAASYILGAVPRKANGFLVFRGKKNTEAFATLQFPGNVLARFVYGFLTTKALERTRWLLVWDRGQAMAEGWIPLKIELHADGSVTRDLLRALGFKNVRRTPNQAHAFFQLPEAKKDVYQANIRSLWHDVASAIRGGQPPLTSGASAIESIRAAERSSRQRLRF